MRTALSSLYQGVVGWFGNLPDRIVEAVRGAGSRFVEGLREIVRRAPGGDLLLRALDAAGNVARQAWEWGKGVARAIGGGAREGLGIRSPSRVFAHIGAMTALGLAVGLQDAAPIVERATQTLLQATQVAPTIEAAIRRPESAPTLRSPEAPPPPPAPLLPVVTALAPTTRETVVHIHVNGAQDPREVAREVVAAIDHWAAGRIVVLGLEALASEVGHDA